MGMTKGVIFEGWIVVTIRKKYDVMTIRKIIKDYDGHDGWNHICRMDCGECQTNNRGL